MYPIYQRTASESPSMASSQPSSPPHRTPKLRASCDGCYLAKVRCTKERPVCSRCKSLSFLCTYSPSQRSGKRRIVQNRTSEPENYNPQTVGIPHRHLLGFQHHYSDTEPSNHNGRLFFNSNSDSMRLGSHPNSPKGSEKTCSSGEQDDSPQKVSNNDPEDQTDSSGAMDITFPFSLSSIPNQHTSDTTAQLARKCGNLPRQLPVATGAPCTLPEQFTDWTSEFSLPMMEDELLSIALPPELSGSSCNCFDSIFEALYALQKQFKSHPTTLDAVLAANQDVIGRGEAILACDCSNDSTSIMLLSGLIAKLLSLYSSISGTSSTSSSSSPESSDFVSITPPARITIGKYTMEGRDEEQMLTEIIMIELRKLNSMLLKFRDKFRGLPAEHESRTYEMLMNFLSTRIREVVNRLQPKVKQ